MKHQPICEHAAYGHSVSSRAGQSPHEEGFSNIPLTRKHNGRHDEQRSAEVGGREKKLAREVHYGALILESLNQKIIQGPNSLQINSGTENRRVAYA